MVANLMESVCGLVTPDFAEKVGVVAGEPADRTRAALLGSVPAIFAALSHTASTPHGASIVFAAVTRAATKRGLAEAREGATQGELFNLFGGRTENITDELARSAGVRRTSAAGILGLMAPLVLTLLGKETMSRGLNAGGLTDLLFSHKKAILDAPSTPGGLGDALGLARLSDLGGPAAAVGGPTATAVAAAPASTGSSAETTAHPKAAPAERAHHPIAGPRRASARWGLPALLLGVLGLVVVVVLTRGVPRALHPDKESPTLGQGREVPDRGTAPGVNGNLRFEEGSTKLTAVSENAVLQLATFLDANPSLQTRIVGFADGASPDSDEALSSARAEAVKDVLVAHGVEGGRIETAAGLRTDLSPSPNPGERRGADVEILRPH